MDTHSSARDPCRWPASLPRSRNLTSAGIAAFLVVFGPIGAAAAQDLSIRPAHPRLLISSNDVAAIRLRCGTQGGDAAAAARTRFGSQRDVLERLRDTTRQIMAARATRDEDLLAPAMLHLVAGEPGRHDEYTRYVTDALLDSHRRLYEFGALVALDWCWDAIEPDQRAHIVDRLPPAPESFDVHTSPLDHMAFYRRLCGLAGAIVRYQSADLDRAETGHLARVITAGQNYLTGPFAAFCRQRGAVPTSGEHGVWEEADYALALELLRGSLDDNLWPELAGSFGRSMEHYFYADTGSPALDHGFIHDDGSDIPIRPGQVFRGFAPVVPWAIAANTRDPVAIWYANRSLGRQGKIFLEVDRYGWVRLVYGSLDDAEADRRACPLGRNFGGGWVAMRTGWTPGETAVLFDVGQPFWRSRQHYDAGQFQIYRKGRLTVPSGDDVTFEAVAAKQGRTLIDGRPGDWDQFFQSTIAHNCVTVTDRKRPQNLYGRPWPALGNQRLIGHTYEPSAGDLRTAGRETGRLLAFETNDDYTYAAADLSPAYEPEVVPAIRRELLLLNAGAVLVLDRVATTSHKFLQAWHLQLPAVPRVVRAPGERVPAEPRETESEGPANGRRGGAESKSTKERDGEPEDSRAGPQLPQGAMTGQIAAAAGARSIGASDGPAAADLSTKEGHHDVPPGPPGARHVYGTEADAGIWELADDHPWLSVTQQDGRLFVRTLLPARSVRRLIGGPGRSRQIPAGPLADRPYFGSSPQGFEYRLWPAAFSGGPTASYELGRPTGLGNNFGVGAAWGRLDVAPAEAGEETLFLHLLVPTDRGVEHPPEIRFETGRQTATLEFSLANQQLRIVLALGGTRGGLVEVRDRSGRLKLEKTLAADVEADADIPRVGIRIR